MLDCHFFVDDGTVVLCSQSGKPTGEEQRLAPGDDPQSVAKRLRRVAWRQERPTEAVPGFGRPHSVRAIGVGMKRAPHRVMILRLRVTMIR